MKKTVIYSSKTGFTKKYAEWIAQELSADLFEASEFSAEKFSDYDAVVYGGGLYAVGISGINLIKKNLDKLKGKKVAVFATGASPGRDEIVREVVSRNFNEEQLQQLCFFYFRGGFDFSRLSFLYKIVMTVMKWHLKMKKNRTPDENGMLAAYEKPVDFTRKDGIVDLISYINSDG